MQQSEAIPHGIPERRIEVSADTQELRLLEGNATIRSYPISTAKRGLGSEEGSYRTPVGRFVVDERIGEGAPEGTIFKSRKPEGLWIPESEDAGDLVLSRILWLHGLDPENANTKERYIYIHGTNHEDSIGLPESHGCIRMRNADVIDLFDRVEVGTPVEIVAGKRGWVRWVGWIVLGLLLSFALALGLRIFS